MRDTDNPAHGCFAGRHLSERPSPAHVHVIGPPGEAVFFLNCPDGPPELRERYGFKLADANRIQRVLVGVLTILCSEWSNLHGNH